MNGFAYGIRRAIAEIIGGFVLSSVVMEFAKIGIITPTYLLLFNIINIVGTLVLFYVMPVWSTVYLIGWIVGIWLMISSGLMGWGDLLLYLVIPLAFLILRAMKWLP